MQQQAGNFEKDLHEFGSGGIIYIIDTWRRFYCISYWDIESVVASGSIK